MTTRRTPKKWQQTTVDATKPSSPQAVKGQAQRRVTTKRGLGAVDAPISKMPSSPRAKRSVVSSTRTSQARRSVTTGKINAPTSARSRRLGRVVRVLLFSDAGFERSALGKSLVQGNCIVTMLENDGDFGDVLDKAGDLDIAIVDCDLPRADVLLTAMARTFPAVPVITWSSHSEDEVRKRIAQKGARAPLHFEKRAPASEALELIRRALGLT